MKFKSSGFDDLINKLDDIAENAQSLEGTQSVSFDELFNSSFMKKYTKMADIDDFFSGSGFVINSVDDFDKLNQNKLNDWVKEHSSFNTWKDMFEKAIHEYTIKRLGL